MDNIILILLCLLAGIILKQIKAVPPNAHLALNQFVIYISLPGLALYYIPKIELGTSLLYPLGIAWLGFILSWILFAALGRYLGWSRRLTGCLILTAGLGNTSFVGFPVIQALYGTEGLKTAIMADQPGTFVVLSTLGILVAALYSKGVAGPSQIAKKILFFPPFVAFTIGMFLNFGQLDFPLVLQSAFSKLAVTITPVALIAVGLQLQVDRRSRHWNFMIMGLTYKLMLMPAFFYILYRIIMGEDNLAIDVSIMEAAMAPMITGAILASSNGLKPRLAGMMVGVGIPLSFATLAFWYWIVTFL